MSAARLISVVFLQIGEVAFQVSDKSVWGLGLVVTFGVVIVEMFRVAVEVTKFGLDAPPPFQTASPDGNAAVC